MKRTSFNKLPKYETIYRSVAFFKFANKVCSGETRVVLIGETVTQVGGTKKRPLLATNDWFFFYEDKENLIPTRDDINNIMESAYSQKPNSQLMRP